LSTSIVILKVTLLLIHVSNERKAEKTVIYENALTIVLRMRPILLRKGCCKQLNGRWNPRRFAAQCYSKTMFYLFNCSRFYQRSRSQYSIDALCRIVPIVPIPRA
jgi:hypothetical protein